MRLLRCDVRVTKLTGLLTREDFKYDPTQWWLLHFDALRTPMLTTVVPLYMYVRGVRSCVPNGYVSHQVCIIGTNIDGTCALTTVLPVRKMLI